MVYNDDTIAALATPSGIGALAIERVSGKEAFSIVEKIVREKEKFRKAEPKDATLYNIVDNENNIIDEVIAIKYKSPNSFTGEDLVEIISHGGYYTVKKILELLIKNGARIADRGEYSRRAFLNGKIDLLKAEAIKAIIESKSEIEYRAAISSYNTTQHKMKEWEEKIKNELSLVDAEIEFGETDGVEERGKEEIRKIKEEIFNEIEKSKRVISRSSGYNVVIAGIANAGKSTLFNLLVGYNRAIVTSIPGTTRDTLKERLEIDGEEINLIDTAGIRSTKSRIEEEGIKRSDIELQRADIIIWISDISKRITQTEKERVEKLDKEKTLFLLNKIDKGKNKQKLDFFNTNNISYLEISLKDRINIDRIFTELSKQVKTLKESTPKEDIFITERQLKLAETIYEDILEAEKNWERKEIASYYLRQSLERIGEIYGRYDNEELINSIFDKFCIGK
ncbi:MAG: tRNA uridine-5-carboxymethylaminomethyl(34) synthesis GTPase MnmE [Chitinispirillaceae bacterium]|nr:tRNA uridine-5-carboxymethylaminomethyl(34) synthesis GTPase MnmE [Chitinispirillaceae bacterium]